MAGQVKSKQRVADHGEVFTAEREVKAMCDLVEGECIRIDSRFLEPACGDGNFLAEILRRKLDCEALKKYKKSSYDWERNSLLVLGSLYGVDILADNCQICRDRLYGIWEKEYRKVCKRDCNDDTRAAAQFIIGRNIVCGNALSLRCVDEQQNDTDVPIIFSEWSFPQNNAFIHRKDYTFAELLDEKPKKKKSAQMSLIDDEPENDGEGKFIEEYVCHYRKLGYKEDNDNEKETE